MEEEVEVPRNISSGKSQDKIGSTQFYNLITGEEVSWQAIIYDLIKTEQLDPWDIDLGVLAEKYAQVIQEMEEANFYVSSKVLYACSLLLRLKAEILSNRFIQELDEAIYGIKDDKKYALERITLDEDEIPVLVPKTPMPRYKKVTLAELMASLHKAIETENRRIRKDIKARQAEKLTSVVLPKHDRIPLKDRISAVFERVRGHFVKPEIQHMTFSQLAPSREEKLAYFLPVLHLSNTDKLYIRQIKHFDEVYMRLEKIKEEIEELKRELGEAVPGDETIEETEEEIAELEEYEKEMEKAFKDKKMKEIDKELESGEEG
ncbi:Segregation and condensation protein A [uncultured archaeon]|nr:Segregation and condensation protein A [uncultured archaeon]